MKDCPISSFPLSSQQVISPDPNLCIDEVGIPDRVAKVLTYPERVFAHNLSHMRK